MGRYLFSIPHSERFDPESMVRAQIIGMEGIPWTSTSTIQDGQLIVFRHVDLSGRLLVPFQSRQHGVIYLTTATLPESEQAWPLDLELARGSLSRLRNQVSIWEESGLVIPESVRAQINRLTEEYAEALFPDGGTTADRTQRCIDVIDDVVNLMFVVADEYSRQVSELARNRPDAVPVQAGLAGSREQAGMLGLEVVQQFARFSSSAPETRIVDVSSLEPVLEWMGDAPAGKFRLAGPVIDFSDSDLPLWLSASESFEQRLSVTKSVCREMGKRFGRQLKLIHAIAGISGVGHQHFNYPQQLQMSIEILETLDRTMPNTSVMASFDQPWGERLVLANGGVPAMEIAESLLRYGARLSAFGLEFNLGYWPQGTLVRDPLQWVDLIDRWSQFGLPLVVYLSAPLGHPDDLPANRFSQTVCRDCLDEDFSTYLQTIANLLASRPAINAIVWKYAVDRPGARFPLAGLIDESGQPKPASRPIAALLKRC